MEKNAYDCSWLEYWVYDCYDSAYPEMPAIERYDFLVFKLCRDYSIPIYYDLADDIVYK